VIAGHISLQPDSLILGMADQLLAEFDAQQGASLDMESLEGRLAMNLRTIVRLIREDFRG